VEGQASAWCGTGGAWARLPKVSSQLLRNLGPTNTFAAYRLPPVQGTHTAMKSGMLAAEAAFNAMTSQPAGRPLDLSAYETSFKSSWVSEG